MKTSIVFLTKLRDACSMIAEACQDELLLFNPTHGKSYSKAEKVGLEINPSPHNDPEKIEWVNAKGAKGEYQRYPASGEVAKESIEYYTLIDAIERHDGTYTHDGMFYWLFTDGQTIGRKASPRGSR